MNPIGTVIERAREAWTQIEEKLGKGIESTYEVGQAIEEKLFADPEIWVAAPTRAYVIPTRGNPHETILIDMGNVRDVLLAGKLPVLSFSVLAGREIDVGDQQLASNIVTIYNQNIEAIAQEALERNEPLQKLLGTVGSIADEGVEIIVTKGLITKVLGGLPGLAIAALWNKPRETVDVPVQLWNVFEKYSGLSDDVDATSVINDVAVKNIVLTDCEVHPLLHNLAINIGNISPGQRMSPQEELDSLPIEVLQKIAEQV